MTDLFFVDTNLLVYQRDNRNPEKNTAADAWIAALWATRRGRISYQVLHEFYAVLRRPQIAVPVEWARFCVEELTAWEPVAPSLASIRRAWELQDRHPLSWRDALIVASASQAGCRYLLTEDLTAGHEYGGVLVVSPLATRPSSLGLA